jgi:signal peptidase I
VITKYIKNSSVKFIVEIVIIIVITLIIKEFIISTATVSGVSMEPTLKNGDRIIVNKLRYNLTKPYYGDIILFPFEGNREHIYVKRIVGKEGDEIDFINNRFVINGYYIHEDFVFSGGDLYYPIIVPKNSYFVLGDNKNGSKDSRYTEVGFIKRDDIIGKVVIRYFPVRDARVIR